MSRCIWAAVWASPAVSAAAALGMAPIGAAGAAEVVVAGAVFTGVVIAGAVMAGLAAGWLGSMPGVQATGTLRAMTAARRRVIVEVTGEGVMVMAVSFVSLARSRFDVLSMGQGRSQTARTAIAQRLSFGYQVRAADSVGAARPLTPQ
jgi:hypothetical protein